MMYNPSELTEEVWKKYTRALTDCNSKTEDYVATRSGGTPWSTDQVYEYLKGSLISTTKYIIPIFLVQPYIVP